MPKINIIYLLPELKSASGGAKVIYNHSLILNSCNKILSSKVLHLKKSFIYKLETSLSKKIKIFKQNVSGWNAKKMIVSRNFLPGKSWYDKKINLESKLNFNSEEDFIIIPEIWAHFANDLKLAERKIKYSIFVQGSFHMTSSDDFKRIKIAYENAEFIITTSAYSLDFIKSIFPKIKNKILKINLHVGINEKLSKTSKKNFITCFPRKLPNHFHLLRFYLNDKLPKNWKLDPILNVSNSELRKKIIRSKIFLSFSNFEGFGLPPLEAALLGNKIIGYDGGGGSEYWKEPIFTKIEQGENYKFGENINKNIKNYDSNWLNNTKKQRQNLIKKYSLNSEKKSLVKLSKKIIKLY